jgi:hypothetical protein
MTRRRRQRFDAEVLDLLLVAQIRKGGPWATPRQLAERLTHARRWYVRRAVVFPATPGRPERPVSPKAVARALRRLGGRVEGQGGRWRYRATHHYPRRQR